MIRVVEGLPDNIVGIVAKGRLTNDDWNTVLKPLFETSLKRHKKVRLYYEIGGRFPGAAWGNLRLGIENVPQWERVAIVTDQLVTRHNQRPALSDVFDERCMSRPRLDLIHLITYRFAVAGQRTV